MARMHVLRAVCHVLCDVCRAWSWRSRQLHSRRQQRVLSPTASKPSQVMMLVCWWA